MRHLFIYFGNFGNGFEKSKNSRNNWQYDVTTAESLQKNRDAVQYTSRYND